MLQYKIECYVAGVIEEPFCLDRNKAEQIEAMREWRRAWRNVEWKMELTEASAQAQDVSLAYPLSIIRGTAPKSCNIDLRQYVGYGYDADTNVVVVARPYVLIIVSASPGKLTSHRDMDSNTIELLPRDPVTGEPHPKRRSDAAPIILDLEEYPDFPPQLKVIVHGDSVMCYTEAELGHPRSIGFSAEYWWFSWSKGYTRMVRLFGL